MFQGQLARSLARSAPSLRRSFTAPAIHSNASIKSATPLLISAAVSLSLLAWSVPTLLADSPTSYVDPTTSTPFPVSMTSPTGATLTLVGTGVRTVSFLSIKVYAVALYVDERSMKDVKDGKIMGWEGYQVERLSPPFPKKDLKEGQLAGEAMVGKLLEQERDFALVITPLRNTSLPHLRDGFSRAIVARLKQPQVAVTLSDEDNERTPTSLQELKSYLPNRPLAAGSPLIVNLNGRERSIRFSMTGADGNEEVLGTVKNAVLAKQLFLSYFSDSGASSEEMRNSAAKGFVGGMGCA